MGDFERKGTTLTHQLCPKLPNPVIHLVCESLAEIRASDVSWNITVCACIPKLHVLVCNCRPFSSWTMFKCTLIYVGVQSSTYHLLSIRKGFCDSNSFQRASILQEFRHMTPVQSCANDASHGTPYYLSIKKGHHISRIHRTRLGSGKVLMSWSQLYI